MRWNVSVGESTLVASVHDDRPYCLTSTSFIGLHSVDSDDTSTWAGVLVITRHLPEMAAKTRSFRLNNSDFNRFFIYSLMCLFSRLGYHGNNKADFTNVLRV